MAKNSFKRLIPKYHIAKPSVREETNRREEVIVIVREISKSQVSISKKEMTRLNALSPNRAQVWTNFTGLKTLGVIHERVVTNYDSGYVNKNKQKRNQPCKCGSNIKYKKCCYLKK